MVDQIKMFKHTYQNVECYKLLQQVQILFIFMYTVGFTPKILIS